MTIDIHIGEFHINLIIYLIHKIDYFDKFLFQGLDHKIHNLLRHVGIYLYRKNSL